MGKPGHVGDGEAPAAQHVRGPVHADVDPREPHQHDIEEAEPGGGIGAFLCLKVSSGRPGLLFIDRKALALVGVIIEDEHRQHREQHKARDGVTRRERESVLLYQVQRPVRALPLEDPLEHIVEHLRYEDRRSDRNAEAPPRLWQQKQD